MMPRPSFLVTAVWALALAGCSTDSTGSNTNWVECDTTQDCPEGNRCVERRCVSGAPEAGPDGGGSGASSSSDAASALDGSGLTCAWAACNEESPCCSGFQCLGPNDANRYQCMRATRDADFCQSQYPFVGHCYPEDTFPCDGSDIGGCPFNLLYGSAPSTFTCCAEMADTGLFACTAPTAATECITGIPSDASAPDPGSVNDGTCGLSCAGACTEGRCTTTFAAGQPYPGGIAVDASRVYWTVPREGRVMSVPLDGGSAEELAAGLPGPVPLAIDATAIYFVNGVDGSVMKLVLSGGLPTVLATGAPVPMGVALDTTSVYWTSLDSDTFNNPVSGSGRVMKVARDGGPAVTLASGLEYPTKIAVHGANVYWVDSNGILSVPTGGGSSAPVVTAPGIIALAIDAANLYWTSYTFDSSTGGVWTAPLAGGSPVEVVSDPWSASGIVLDGESLYWASSTGPQALGAISKVPAAGGATTPLATRQAGPRDVAVDTTSVYFTTADAIMKTTPK